MMADGIFVAGIGQILTNLNASDCRKDQVFHKQQGVSGFQKVTKKFNPFMGTVVNRKLIVCNGRQTS